MRNNRPPEPLEHEISAARDKCSSQGRRPIPQCNTAHLDERSDLDSRIAGCRQGMSARHRGEASSALLRVTAPKVALRLTQSDGIVTDVRHPRVYRLPNP